MYMVVIADILVIKHVTFLEKLGIMHLEEYTDCQNLRQLDSFF